MRKVNLHEVGTVARLQPCPAPSRTEQIRCRRGLFFGDKDVPVAREPAGVGLYLPQLLERVYPDVRVRADGESDIALQDSPGRQESVAEVPLRGRAGAH